MAYIRNVKKYNPDYPHTKLVNVYPGSPVTTLNPPIRCRQMRVHKPVEHIREILIKRGKVQEILNDGTTIWLGFHNYDTDNRVNTKAKDENELRKKAEEALSKKSQEKSTGDKVVNAGDAPAKKLEEMEEVVTKDIENTSHPELMNGTPDHKKNEKRK